MPADPRPRSGASGDAGAAATGAAGDWRSALAGLAGAASDRSGSPRHDERADAAGASRGAATRPLGLQFELRRRVPRRSGQWQGPRDEPARRAASVDRLAVRPVKQGARGAWIKDGLTWQNIAYQASAAGVDPAQSRWFAQFAMLKGTTPAVYAYGSEWITLDEFESPLLWALLAEAGRLGVALVGSDATPEVVLRGSASVGLDARMEPSADRVARSAVPADRVARSAVPADRVARSAYRDPDGSGLDTALRAYSTDGHGALVLTPTVVIDGDAHPVEAVRATLGHGLYRFDFDAGRIELAPLAAELTPAQRALLDEPRVIRVPADEVPVFLRGHFHGLAGSLPITSLDGSFEAPPLPPATLVLAAAFEPGDILRLSWTWEHADGRTSPVEASAAGAAGTTGAAGVAALAAAAADPDLDDDLLARVLDELGWVPLGALVLRGIDAAEFAVERMPRLERLADGGALRIDVTGDRPDYREATATAELRVTTVESRQRDWFDLGVWLTVDGKPVPFMPLFRALAKGQRRLLLVDKSYLSLADPRFDELRDLIEEAGTVAEWETGLRIHRSQASLWADFEDLADVSEPAVSWRATVAGLDGGVEELPPPAGLALPLRPYQLAGFRWLAYLWANGLGGILADDMGLGKTAQALALVQHAVEAVAGRGAPDAVAGRGAPDGVAGRGAPDGVAGRVAPDAIAGRVAPDGVGRVSRPAALTGLDTAAPTRPAGRGTGLDTAAPTRPAEWGTGLDTAAPTRPAEWGTGLDTAAPARPAERGTGLDTAAPARPAERGTGLDTAAPARPAGAGARAAPFLVVAPTSVASNWVREAERFTPGLRVASVTATQSKRRQSIADAAAGVDLVVTTYAVLRLEAAAFAEVEWGGLVLDEAQFVKNPATKVHEAARGIRAPFKLAVTGTPMENHVGELWALLDIVAPGLFPSRRRFDERYRRPIENDGNAERLALLRRRIRPLMLRRTKELVAPELPPKQEQVLEVELAPKHRRLYDVVLQRERQKLLGLIDDLDRQRFIVYRSLTLLRMLALDASLVDAEAYAGIPSAKLDALFEQLDDVLAEGHRALVFSQFTTFLGRAASRLDAAGVPYTYLDGSTPVRRRDAEIARFRAGEASVFLISLKAGGFGLNLTEADYVFLLDPWWNPASEAQAIDRTHRIGQAKQVMVYRLVAAGTIEEKVMELKARKGELVSSILSGDADAAFAGSLTADDLRGLLEG
ncbi:SNF2-related protein [Agromyces tardus]|uniref:DEAD/DEAH box helicase n=1 Tax=Agromyces tardus TaxID=2583849 RepID=UPI00361328B5